MRYILLTFLLLSTSSFLKKNNDLKILSYNIRYDNPDDGINKWEKRKGTIINYIKTNAPEIIGMQEVLNNQLIDLQSYLNEYKTVGVGREDGKTKGEYSPILFKTSKLKLIKFDTFWLSETPEKVSKGWDAALERICTYALFEQINTKKQFLVFNTHFDHIGVNARIESVKLILKMIKKNCFEKNVTVFFYLVTALGNSVFHSFGGSFSAVSTRMFATKDSFCGILGGSTRLSSRT